MTTDAPRRPLLGAGSPRHDRRARAHRRHHGAGAGRRPRRSRTPPTSTSSSTPRPPPRSPGHTTYRLAEEPELVLPWTYADARAGGTFERVGGGPLDPATGDWGQGAYNADDVSRAAVVYLRHWQQTGDDASRAERLRAAAFPRLPPDGRRRRTPATWCCGCSPTASSIRAPSPSSCPTRRTPTRATGSPARSGPSVRGTRPSPTPTPPSRRSSPTGWASPVTPSTASRSTATASTRPPTA